MILDEAVNNLQTFPSKGSNCCENQLYVQDLVPKFLVRISCIMTRYKDPYKEYLRRIILSKFLNVWKVSKACDINFASFYLLMNHPVKLSYLLFVKIIFSLNQIVSSDNFIWKRLSCQANQLLGILKINLTYQSCIQLWVYIIISISKLLHIIFWWQELISEVHSANYKSLEHFMEPKC
jgi:hypothetical protein